MHSVQEAQVAHSFSPRRLRSGELLGQGSRDPHFKGIGYPFFPVAPIVFQEVERRFFGIGLMLVHIGSEFAHRLCADEHQAQEADDFGIFFNHIFRVAYFRIGIVS